jgi:hypothetical protein
MTSRMEENRVKAVIYLLLFITLIVRNFFLQPSVQHAQSQQESTEVQVVVRSGHVR